MLDLLRLDGDDRGSSPSTGRNTVVIQAHDASASHEADRFAAPLHRLVRILGCGPYATILFAGLCAIGAALLSSASQALWVLALSSYVSVFTNLNPLVELDGYYVLVHLTERPNLRPKALAWLATEAPAALRHPSRIKSHGVEALYGVLSIAYLGVTAILIVVLYRAVLQRWVAGLVPGAIAELLAWVVAVGACLLIVLGVAGDLVVARGRSRKA